MRLLCYSSTSVRYFRYEFWFEIYQIIILSSLHNLSRICPYQHYDRYRTFKIANEIKGVNLALQFVIRRKQCLFKCKTLILLSSRSQRTTSFARIPKEYRINSNCSHKFEKISYCTVTIFNVSRRPRGMHHEQTLIAQYYTTISEGIFFNY